MSGVNWTEQQLAEYQRSVAELDQKVATHRVEMGPQATKIQRPRFNKWEGEYAQELENQKRVGLITGWWFESVKLRLADGCWYLPDFMVQIAGAGNIKQFHEVKGFWRDDALVKFKVAAEQFPFRFMALRKRKVSEGGGWEIIRNIGPTENVSLPPCGAEKRESV